MTIRERIDDDNCGIEGGCHDIDNMPELRATLARVLDLIEAFDNTLVQVVPFAKTPFRTAIHDDSWRAIASALSALKAAGDIEAKGHEASR